MSLKFYQAMTEAEIRNASVLPRYLAYMACHFSPYGVGLVNIPERLPPNSLLIVNDRVPVLQHDPEQIAKQLFYAVRKLKALGVLLDLQTPGNPQTTQIVKKVVNTLPCAVGVSEQYADDLSCPIFCSPSIHQPLEEYINTKKGRPLWLEVFQEAEFLAVTSSGCERTQGKELPGETYFDESLQCTYRFALQKDRVTFQLLRQARDIPGYIQAAEKSGIEVAIGLYQQFRDIPL